jgi:hypothetical protein
MKVCVASMKTQNIEIRQVHLLCFGAAVTLPTGINSDMRAMASALAMLTLASMDASTGALALSTASELAPESLAEVSLALSVDPVPGSPYSRTAVAKR